MASRPPAGAPEFPQRRYDIDALRVLATLLLIVFHTARAFDSDPWHVKNDELTLGMDVLVTFMNNWHMPLFFLLAGAGSFFGLRFRTGKDYVVERFKRLFIPFVAGVLLIIPPQVYMERIGTAPTRQSPINFDGSFLEFYPRFFTQGIYPEGNLSWHHLWFVIYLFLFSLVLLPLFLYLNKNGRGLVERFATFFSQGRALFLLALPIIVIELALAGKFPGPQDFVHDLTNILRSMTLLVYGYLLMSDDRLQRAVNRNGVMALVSALVLTGVIAALLLTFDWPAYTLMYVVVHSVWALCSWSWLLTFLWLGNRYLNVDRPWLRHTSEIAYPFYILHQSVIVVLAHFVLQWQTGVMAKYAVIGTVSLVVTWLLSEAAKLSNITRFIFGMKGRKGSAPISRGAAEAGR